jgi:hypothetical protein
MLLNLHLLRAAAALAVAYFHVTSEAGLNFRVHVGARAPDRFLLPRLTRIVPGYRTATLAVFGLAAVAPGLTRRGRRQNRATTHLQSSSPIGSHCLKVSSSRRTSANDTELPI